MSTATVIRAGSNFSSTLGILAPVTSGLVAWSWCGYTEAATEINRSGGSANTLLNNATVSSGYITGEYASSLAKGLELPMADTANCTLLLVYRRKTTFSTKPSLMGFRAATAPMNFLFLNNTDKLNFRIYDASNAQANCTGTKTKSGATTWEFVACTIADGVSGVAKLYDVSGAETLTTNYTGPRKIIPANCRVGTAADATASLQPGPIDIAFAACYNVTLDSTQITDMYNFVKTALASRSITVT